MATKNEKEKDQQQEEFSSKISDEINCPVCLDILVNPLTLVPCGHSFCRNCCFSESIKNGKRRRTLCFSKCPHCRQSIKETVPSRQLDSLIDTLVTVPNLLFRNEDDKQHYLKRREAENKRSRILAAPARTKKRRRVDDHPLVFNDYIATTARRGAHPQVYHAPNHYQNPYQLPPNRHTARTNQASFDPMVAPLPPPYDFSVTGPILGITGSSETSRSRGSTTAAAANITGISANDPICID